MKKLMKLAGLALLAAVSLTLWAQDDGNDRANNDTVTKEEKATAPEAHSAAPSVPTDYVIGADDTLHISVWKEPDMTVSLPVRPDGKISIPLLDDVQAAGMTPMQLAALIKTKLKKYIEDPRVTVVVTAMNSQRIFVLGEVTHSGPMALLPSMTVLQALSSAGFTQFSNLKGIYLLRTQDGQETKIPFKYKDAIRGKSAQTDLMLKPGDTIVVP
ncbi:MAG TPA: polysaccharide biosynthesis/export family protein [Candidatus Aquilonibacter sp.]|nr:polysaccharide biosynthesis/export family protein [Candidatus Aquilonibacter sp.]